MHLYKILTKFHLADLLTKSLQRGLLEKNLAIKLARVRFGRSAWAKLRTKTSEGIKSKISNWSQVGP